MPRPDVFSLIIGLLLGVFIAFLAFAYKKFFKKHIKLRINKPRHNLKAEPLLRKLLLRELEGLHLSPDICRLSDIYVTQKLLANPIYLNPQTDLDDVPVAFLNPLSISDIPELSGGYPLPLLTVSEALSGGINIAIKGKIGAGKTTALANLAIEILEHRCDNRIFNDFLPIYVHVRDLSAISGDQNLQTILYDLLITKYSKIKPAAIQNILTTYLGGSRLLLLIDGLDELSHAEFTACVKMINIFVKEHPAACVVTVTGPFHTGELYKSGFVPLTIKPPELPDFFNLVDRFIDVQQKTVGLKDGEIIRRWLKNTSPTLNYHSMTLLISSCLDDRTVKGDMELLDSYLRRVSNNSLSANDMVTITENMVSEEYQGISAPEFENLLKILLKWHDGFENTKITVPSLIGKLRHANVISASANGRYRLTIPATLCLLLSKSSVFKMSCDWRYLLHNPIFNQITRLNPKSDYLAAWLKDSDGPACRNLIMALDHFLIKKGPFHETLLDAQPLAKELMNKANPLSMRYKIALVLSYTQPKIFTYLLGALEKSDEHENHILFASLLQNISITPDFFVSEQILLSNDPAVKLYTQNYLICRPDKDDYGLIDLTMSSPIGRSLAETIALISHDRKKRLHFYTQSDNPNCRRNAAYGLRLINESWADQELEKLNTDDVKWMVRDAAAYAIGNKWDPKIYSPTQSQRQLVNTAMSDLALKKGIASPADSLPDDLVNDLIKSQNYEELLGCAAYLYSNPCERNIKLLISMTQQENPVREIAYQALQDIYFRS